MCYDTVSNSLFRLEGLAFQARYIATPAWHGREEKGGVWGGLVE